MKKEMTLITKIRIIVKWLRNQKDSGLMGACSRCDSTRVIRIDSSTRVDGINTLYSAKYECLDCHATALCNELWTDPDSSE